MAEERVISKSELIARSRGYTGPWPMGAHKLKRPETKEEFDELMDMAEDGDHRTSIAASFGKWTSAFYGQITTDDMVRMAKILKRIFVNKLDTIRARISAVESVVKLANDLARVIPDLSKLRKTELQVKLESLLLAFMDEIGEEGFSSMSDFLLAQTKEKDAKLACYAIKKLHGLMVKTLDMSIAISRANPSEPSVEIRDDDPKIIAAREQFARLAKSKRA